MEVPFQGIAPLRLRRAAAARRSFMMNERNGPRLSCVYFCALISRARVTTATEAATAMRRSSRCRMRPFVARCEESAD